MSSSPRGRVRVGMWLGLAVTASGVAFGCNSILGFSDYEVGGDGGSSGGASSGNVGGDGGSSGNAGDGGDCIDPTGFGGRGCYKCEPKTAEQIQSACTTAAFEAFDNAARIEGFDPANPKPAYRDGGAELEKFDAGAPPPPDPDAGDSGPVDETGPCPTPGNNAVFISGSTGFPMGVIQQAMGTRAQIFYEETSSCAGIQGIVQQNTIKAGAKVSTYSRENGTGTACYLGAETPIDLGTTSLFADSCADVIKPLPASVVDELGPVNPVGFITPAATNEQHVISGEAAYRVYGTAGNSGVAPWDDEHFVFRRTKSSGNQTAIALTLGLPVDGLRGVDSAGSSNMKKAITTSPEPEKTIGISSSDVIDPARTVLKWLAFQNYGQPVGFYPDSSQTSFDRRNVRDGHYFIWLSLHIFANTGATGQYGSGTNDLNLTRSPDLVKEVAFVMSNRIAPPESSVDVFGALGTNGNVPQCAMRVTRARDGAPLTPYTPPLSCGCAYEAAVPNGVPPNECKRCSTSEECGGDRPTCSFGFCE